MKKGWKIFWIVCAVLAAAGLLLAAAGVALGGLGALRSSGELEVGITSGWLERLGVVHPDTDNSSSDTPGEEKNHIPGGEGMRQYDGIEEITLDLGGLAVCVTAEDTAGVQVDTTQLRSDIREKVEKFIECDDGGRELKIDIEEHLHDWNTNETGTLYITVPKEKRFESFSADIGAGALEINGLGAYELSLDVNAGQITAENFETDYLEAECGAGEIILQGSARKEAEIKCKLGSIMYTLPGKQSDYDYELSWGAGEVKLGNDLYSGILREAEINNGSSRMIEADCGMGNIDIQFE